MTNAIVGGQGDMGKNLLVPLLSKLGEVRVVSKNDSVSDWKKIWQSDAIWLSIPRDEISRVTNNIKLKPHQLIIDICSIKRGVSKILAQTGPHLSLHPLHGPHIPLNGQKWAVIKTQKKIKEHLIANEILSFLQNQGIQLLDEVTEDEHDFMMGIVLGFPEILTIIMDKIINVHAQANRQNSPPIEKIMEWAVPASNALYSFYIRSIDSSADWLRDELINQSAGDFKQSIRIALLDLSQNLTDESIKKALKEQRAKIEKLPKQERVRVKQWIERWFADATQKIFSFHRQKAIQPKITIQKISPKVRILSERKDKLRVGIHGIEGSFSHESLTMICKELNLSQSQITAVYLVEAKKVLAAVNNGAVDIGILAVANSGSGAYVSSFEAMSQSQFEILGIYGMEIMQCLIAHRSVRSINEIKEVFGHPQAVSQCKRTFVEKYPDIKLIAGKDSDDTALCVKRIAESDLPHTTATLASQVAARIYGAKILEFGMHHDPFNTTTFVIIKKRA